MVVVLAVVLIMVSVSYSLYGPGHHSRPNAERFACQSNLKTIALGFKQYVQDYDEKFPPAKVGNLGWVELLQPYLNASDNTTIFQCPSDKSGEVQGRTDYFYNSQLAGKMKAQLTFPANTIVNGDGRPNAPSNASFAKLPANWNRDPKSPAWRHLEAANYLYVDGHVGFFRAVNIDAKNSNPDYFATIDAWQYSNTRR